MTPRLVALTGALKGQTLPLSAKEITLGRDTSSGIVLNDLSMSRMHCTIRKEGESFRIIDLDSLNGTFVNKVPVKERVLQHGDQIEVGHSTFLFLLQSSEESAETFELLDAPVSFNSTIRVAPAEALRVNREYPTSAVLQKLLDASVDLARSKNTTTFGETLLDCAMQNAPADHGVVIFSDFRSTVFAGGKKFPVSSTTLEQVRKEKDALLLNDGSASQASKSLIEAKVHSLICAPLFSQNQIVAYLYIYSTNPTGRLEESHLQFIAALTAIASAPLQNILQAQFFAQENTRLQSELNLSHQMIGDSPRMREVFRSMAKIAPVDSTVLLTGESGTGKELVARAIHANSPRAGHAFVAINCANLSDTLLESELFGYEKGAFTGAMAQKKGKIEIADGGTLFLDEVVEMTSALQAKLLRVLQERQFERVGGTRTISVDIRIIAATNRDLKKAVQERSFREDLFYRLNVVNLPLPPLRDRREDIPVLAMYFLKSFAEKFNRPITGISPECRSLLQNYDWPGNVRELQNVIERAVVIGSSDVILPEDLPEDLFNSSASQNILSKYHDVVAQTKKDLILKALKDSNGNFTEAAKILGLHPNYLHRLIRNLNLRPLMTKPDPNA